MERVGEDFDAALYSNAKVSLTFSTLRWLLILVAFPRAAYGTAWPVDIYRLIWLRAMAFYKEKHLHVSHSKVLLPPLRVTHEDVVALNKHKSTFTGREPCCFTLPFKVCKNSIFWELGPFCSRSSGQLIGLLNWTRYWWFRHHIVWTAKAATRGSPLFKRDQVKVCPLNTDRGSG